jgi:YbbR domain-containing protein
LDGVYYFFIMEQKRYHIVIASFLFAALTWISVNLREEYTIVKHFPVVLENLKQGKALKYPFPKMVNVRFKASGWSLAGLYLTPDLHYSIDLSTLGPDDFFITAKDLPEHVKLPVALQPIEVAPDTMMLAIDDYREKRVPITINLTTVYKLGYGQVGSVRVTPESITIGGSRHLIESIASWPTVYKKFDELNTPLSIDLPLEEPTTPSVKLLNNSAHIQVDVQPFAEKVFTGITVAAVSIPLNREVIFIPPKMDIIVRGGIDQLARLSTEDFQVSVNYQELIADTTETIQPAFTSPPEIKVVSKKPERFQYIIRKKL